MNGWTLPFDSDVLLTIGWGVLMTAAIGIVAAVVTWASQFALPAMPAGRRAWFVLAVLVGSLALAWAGPAAELLPQAGPVIPAARMASAWMTAPGTLAITSSVPSSLRADTATVAFVGTSVRIVAVAWMLLAAWLLVRLAGGLWMTGRIRRRCRSVASDDLTGTAERLRARLGIRRRVQVLHMDEAGAPFSMGWRYPVIVMPRRTAEALSPAQVESLLAHELAHVRRADYPIGIVQAALDALCWFSPGHRQLSDEVRTLREQACDDLALSVARDVRTYATALGSAAQHGASAPLPAAMCAVDRHVAIRIRRLLGHQVLPRATWARTSVAAALLAFGCAAGVTVHSASSMPSGFWAPGQASGGATRAHLERTGIPLGFAPRIQGSPVVLSEVTPSASYVFDTVSVRNASPDRVTSVTLVAIVEWIPGAGGSGRPVLALESEPVGLSLLPDATVTIPLELLPVEQAMRLKAESDGRMQVFLSVVAAVTDSSVWSMPILHDAATHREAMGVPPATVPGSMVSASPPIGPASALCRTDEPDSHTSPGGIVAIRGEPGRFAKCVNGGWTEVAADESAASDVVRLQFDLRRDGILFGSPAVMVQNDRTATLSVDHGATRIAVTPRRVGESVELAFVIVTAAQTMTPRLIVRGREAGSISWKSPEGSTFELIAKVRPK